MSIWRTACVNVIRLRDKYVPLAVISFIGSALVIAALITLNCAANLNHMLDLPYKGFYQAVPIEKDHMDSNETTYLGAWGYSAESFLKAHLAIDTVYVTKTYQKELHISPINVNNELSSKDYGQFPVFVMPNSAFDSSFRKGERVLVAGRHLSYDDKKNQVLLIDEILAQANNLSVGDAVIMMGDTGEFSYKIVGIYKTIKIQREVVALQDMLCNAIITSSVPDESGQKTTQMYDLYIKFAPGVDISGFFAYMDRFPRIYGPTSAGFQFLSVDNINETYNKGVNTLFSISSILLLALLFIIIAATLAFCKLLISSRRREILILRAINATPARIANQLLLEIFYVYSPFSILGTVGSAIVCRSAIGNLLAYFSSIVTPENLRNTSSFYVENINNLRQATVEYIPINLLSSTCILVFMILSLIIFLCATIQIFLVNREKMMVLLSEGRS